MNKCKYSEIVEYYEVFDELKVRPIVGMRCLHNSRGCFGGICEEKCECYKRQCVDISENIEM